MPLNPDSRILTTFRALFKHEMEQLLTGAGFVDLVRDVRVQKIHGWLWENVFTARRPVSQAAEPLLTRYGPPAASHRLLPLSSTHSHLARRAGRRWRRALEAGQGGAERRQEGGTVWRAPYGDRGGLREEWFPPPTFFCRTRVHTAHKSARALNPRTSVPRVKGMSCHFQLTNQG